MVVGNMPSPNRFKTAHRILSTELERYGFDICHQFHPSWYNDSIKNDDLPAEILPPFPNASPHSTAFLVGNTKNLWPVFLNWLYREKHVSKVDSGDDDILHNDPLDAYTKEVIGKVIDDNSWRLLSSSSPSSMAEDTSSGKRNGGLLHKSSRGMKCNGTEESIQYDVYWAADTSKERLVSMQRISQVSGLCYLDEATNMACHPTYGPWISFRAAIVLTPWCCTSIEESECDDLVSPPPPERLAPGLLRKEEAAAAREYLQQAFDEGRPDEVHKYLIASRDCITLGKEKYRFTESQILYHYTQNVRYILEGIEDFEYTSSK